MPKKIILDVDTGRDDAVAMLMAGHHPALELVAVLPVHGNAPLERTLDNTLRTLEAGGFGTCAGLCWGGNAFAREVCANN